MYCIRHLASSIVALPRRCTCCARCGVLCDDGRCVAAGVFADLGYALGELDELGERRLRLLMMLRAVAHVAFDIDPQRRALSACAREAEDDARTVFDLLAQALAASHAVIFGVGVAEVVRFGDGMVAEAD